MIDRESTPPIWDWIKAPAARWVGGNEIRLLEGGDDLFPAMRDAIAGARQEIWFATYIFHDDSAGRALADALVAAAQRGVDVHIVVDGFGSKATLTTISRWLGAADIEVEVFRPIDRWWRWFQPGQLRRLHQKMCIVDERIAFVGGINIIDDRNDLVHGWSDTPRLDFAVEVRGPLAARVQQALCAMWARARLGHVWRGELRRLAHSDAPLKRAIDLMRNIGVRPSGEDPQSATAPMSAVFVVRDNVSQRRSIEHRYIEAMRRAKTRIDIACPYFYPGQGFRRALSKAARRGVRVRLLLQGKIDYRVAALAARVLYDDLRRSGVRIYEYMPAFLHAKVALIDDHWATVGSSNIDPLSLLLNLEANVIVRDPHFCAELARRLDVAFSASAEITLSQPAGWRGWLRRGVVAWGATVYLRVAGITGRY